MAEIHTSQAACHKNTSQERLSSSVSARASSLISRCCRQPIAANNQILNILNSFSQHLTNSFWMDCSQSWNETEQLWRIRQTLLTVASTLPWFHTAVRVFGLQLLQLEQVNYTYISGTHLRAESMLHLLVTRPGNDQVRAEEKHRKERREQPVQRLVCRGSW